MKGHSTYQSMDKSRMTDNRVDKNPQLWKLNNQKAQKNGAHHTIYWVQPKKKTEDGSVKGESWSTSSKYIGDWNENKKCGFGIQYYSNGNKYEGGWDNNMRNGHGTLWILEGKKLRREYTGEWHNDKKNGRGTMYFKNEDRYDGYWVSDLPQGEGRMIYSNGDIYEGSWSLGKKSGYGVMTKRNGDHFEGQWVNDMREGQGSYFFASKNKVFVGEWVDDMPKAGVYSEVEDPDSVKVNRLKQFTDPYELPNIPQIKLGEPSDVLKSALEDAKQSRLFYRAKHIPIQELFSKDEVKSLHNEFENCADQEDMINLINLKAILQNLNFEESEEEIKEILVNIEEDADPDQIDFELMTKVVAVLYEIDHYRQENMQNMGGDSQISESADRQYGHDESSQVY